jgi:hypothetical protein
MFSENPLKKSRFKPKKPCFEFYQILMQEPANLGTSTTISYGIVIFMRKESTKR